MRNNKIGLVGFGPKTGVSMLRYLCKEDVEVCIYDEKTADELQEELSQVEGLSFEKELGKIEPEKLFEYPLWMISPGVPLSHSYFQKAKEKGIVFTNEIEFACDRLNTNLIAITGSVGKSTLTSLMGNILNEWGKKVFVGGNIGTPLIDAVGKDYDFVVAELSSFQLELCDHLRPNVAVITNIYENHLDRHKTLEEYAKCKSRIFMNMDETEKVFISRSVHEFSNSDWFQEAVCKMERVEYEDVDVRAWNPKLHIEAISFALAIASEMGCPYESIQMGVETFEPLPHRMEFMHLSNSHEVINDSKSTSLHATLGALYQATKPTRLLMGGQSKRSTYASLLSLIKEKVTKVYAFGEAAEKIQKELSCEDIQVECYSSMKEAGLKSLSEMQDGESLLLSPANPSLDEFKNFEDRGEVFKKMAQNFFKS